MSYGELGEAGDGEIAGGSDDFKTVNANSSYTTRKTTNGWVGTNCAVMQGGTSDNNPTFGLVVFSEFISEGIGGSRETPAYCFFISVKTMIALVAELHFVCEVS